jgi:hypothetical protein
MFGPAGPTPLKVSDWSAPSFAIVASCCVICRRVSLAPPKREQSPVPIRFERRVPRRPSGTDPPEDTTGPLSRARVPIQGTIDCVMFVGA